MTKTKTTTPLRQVYFGEKPIQIEKNIKVWLKDPKLGGKLTAWFEENERIMKENNSLKEKLKEKDQEITNLKNGFDAERINWGNERTKLEKQISAITVSRDEAWKQLDNSHKFTDKIWVYLGNYGTNPPLYSLDQLKWLLRKHDKPTTDNDYYTLYDLLRKRDEHIAEIKQLRTDLSTANDKLKTIASIDPRTTPEYKLLQTGLEKWTNIFPTNIYSTPNEVAKKITDLQTDLATKISISLEDQKKIDGYDALKLERDNLKIRRDNWKAKFENAELRLVDLPVNWKTELARIPDLEKRPDIPISKSDWENDWSKRPTLTNYNNLLANQKPSDLPENWKELNKTVKNQKGQIDKLVQQLGKEQEQTKNLRTNIQSLTNENEALKKKLKDLENENSKKIQTLSSLKTDVDNILTKWKANNLAQLSSSVEATINKRNQLKLENNKLEKEKTENKKTIDNQAETIRKLQQEIIDLEKLKNKKDTCCSNAPNAHELLEEAQKELEEIKKELRELKGDIKPKEKKTNFDLFGSNTIEQWIEQWKQFPSSTSTLIPNGDKLFSHLEKHGEYYDGKYNYKQLNEIFEKLKEQIKKDEENEENDPQKLKGKIKSLKKEREKYLPNEHGNTNCCKEAKNKELTKEIDRLERKLANIKSAESLAEIRKIPRSIDGWFKEFQITKLQLDKLHKLNEAGITSIDFDNTLYAWEEIEEILKKSLPLKKQTIKSWWLKGKVLDENYTLLRKAGIDTEKEEMTLAKVNSLIVKYDKQEEDK